jgi:hypothetical protein
MDPLTASYESPLATGPEAPVNTSIDEIEWTSRTRPIVLELGVTDTDGLLQMIEAEEAHVDCRDLVWLVRREICQVLEGLGYDISEVHRRYTW